MGMGQFRTTVSAHQEHNMAPRMILTTDNRVPRFRRGDGEGAPIPLSQHRL